MREDWKKIIEEEMMKDVESIMEEINSNPAYKDVVAPEEIHDRLFAQIHEYEQQRLYKQLSDEDKELIRLGKVYKKRRKLSKCLILVAAVLVVLGIGTVCIGKDENIFRVISSMFTGGERTLIDSESTELTTCVEAIEVYERIEAEYGLCPAELGYLPVDTKFEEAVFGTEIQNISMIYTTKNGTMVYTIRPNYRESSYGTIIKDEKLREYSIVVEDVEVDLTEYKILESDENRWVAHFYYRDIQYRLEITNMQQIEVEKIINNLKF